MEPVSLNIKCFGVNVSFGVKYFFSFYCLGSFLFVSFCFIIFGLKLSLAISQYHQPQHFALLKLGIRLLLIIKVYVIARFILKIMLGRKIKSSDKSTVCLMVSFGQLQVLRWD